MALFLFILLALGVADKNWLNTPDKIWSRSPGANTYIRQGDYFLPCLSLPAEKETKPIGVWGQRHLRYLKQHRKVLYTNLLTSGKLNSYLVDIDEQAEDTFLRLVKQIAEREGLTEQLKAENSMLWVQTMNSIRNRAMDIVNEEIIYN